MLMLVIDTSTERAFFGILKDFEVHYFQMLPFGYNNSTHLIPLLEKGLLAAGINIADIDCFSVGVGPGSYTGIRVAAVVAKTLSFAQNRPLIAFSSLKIFTPECEGVFASIIDAKIGGAYLLKGVKKDREVAYQSIPAVYSLDDLGSQLQDIDLLITPQSQFLKKKMDEKYPLNHWQWQEKDPEFAHLAPLLWKKYREKNYSLTSQLDLLYLRKTQAEIESSKSHC